MSSVRVFLIGVLLFVSLFLLFGAWSAYTTPFISSFGYTRLALADKEEMKNLEEISRLMEQNPTLAGLGGEISERIQHQKNIMFLYAAGSAVALFWALFVSGLLFKKRKPLSLRLHDL